MSEKSTKKKKPVSKAGLIDYIKFAEDNLLIKRGNHWVLKCPHHPSSVTSCVINRKKMTYSCYKCSKNGTLDELNEAFEG